jgi:hypothetical protein
MISQYVLVNALNEGMNEIKKPARGRLIQNFGEKFIELFQDSPD